MAHPVGQNCSGMLATGENAETRKLRFEFGDDPISNYPPAKPEALRWLAPQRDLIATVGKRPLTRPRPSATLSPREREEINARGAARHYSPLRGVCVTTSVDAL